MLSPHRKRAREVIGITMPKGHISIQLNKPSFFPVALIFSMSNRQEESQQLCCADSSFIAVIIAGAWRRINTFFESCKQCEIVNSNCKRLHDKRTSCKAIFNLPPHRSPFKCIGLRQIPSFCACGSILLINPRFRPIQFYTEPNWHKAKFMPFNYSQPCCSNGVVM